MLIGSNNHVNWVWSEDWKCIIRSNEMHLATIFQVKVWGQRGHKVSLLRQVAYDSPTTGYYSSYVLCKTNTRFVLIWVIDCLSYTISSSRSLVNGVAICWMNERTSHHFACARNKYHKLSTTSFACIHSLTHSLAPVKYDQLSWLNQTTLEHKA